MSVTKCDSLRNQLQTCMAIYDRSAKMSNQKPSSIENRSEVRNISKSPKHPRVKRRVTFADAHGRPLYTEKIFAEAPDEPPVMRTDRLNAIVERLRLNLKPESTNQKSTKTFELLFSQPMSDYLKFKSNLDREKVSLENLVVRQRAILGTIKVKNICFDKTVTIRITYDHWETCEDIEATFIKNAYEGDWTNTFKFSTTVPASYNTNKTIEFCVRYKTGTSEHWDNNSGQNYRLICVNPSLMSPDGDHNSRNILIPEDPSESGSIFY